MKAVLVIASTLATAGAAAGLSAPARVTLDGVGGVRPGMNVAAVSAAWGVTLRPDYEVRPSCGSARLERSGIVGQVIFMPRGRFGAVFLRKGAVTGRGIRIGSTRSCGVPTRTEAPGRTHTFMARTITLCVAHGPHTGAACRRESGERVTQIAFGARASVRLDEGCA